MTEQFTQPLNPSISQCTDLFTVEFLPSFPIELFEEFDYDDWVNKVDERVAYIALVLFR